MRAIVLPVKSLSESKTRLAPMLSPLERGALTLAMLEDVMDVTQQVLGWDTWVVSPDEAVLEIALGRSVHAIREEKPPLANAIRQVEEEKGVGFSTIHTTRDRKTPRGDSPARRAILCFR